MKKIFCERIYQKKEKFGWIELKTDGLAYYVNLYVYGIRNSIESVKTSNYNYALHKFVIMKNKYSH